MPRYKFAWSNLPPELLKALVRDLQLDGSEPVEALRAEYGARPGEGFVLDAWDCLRDRWLGASVRSVLRTASHVRRAEAV
jgi:hypothetical protein